MRQSLKELLEQEGVTLPDKWATLRPEQVSEEQEGVTLPDKWATLRPEQVSEEKQQALVAINTAIQYK